MIIDKSLIRQLNQFDMLSFKGVVFRATRLHADPTDPTAKGGRWAPRPLDEPGYRVLYTSLDRNCAVAEVASFLQEQTPPISVPLMVSEIALTASRVMELERPDLQKLGVDLARYGEREYSRTQQIGVALNQLNFDALIAPSARSHSRNLMLFADNHGVSEQLQVLNSKEIDLETWNDESA